MQYWMPQPKPIVPKIVIHRGDCFDLFRLYNDSYFHSLICDPPAGIDFMNQNWDDLSNHEPRTATGAKIAPTLQILQDVGVLQKWEAGFLLFTIDWASSALRVLKPGGHGLVWALPRTSDLTKFGLRLAGFEVRDTIYHATSQGMPKSLDIGKAVDKIAGAEREVVGSKRGKSGVNINAPETDEAKLWDGWGSGLKPAVEEWILIRKPIEGTIAENALEHGVGGINIDGCRVPITDGAKMARSNKAGDNGWSNPAGGPNNAAKYGEPTGRFPANFTHDGSDEVLSLFPLTKSGTMKAGQKRKASKGKGGYQDGFPDEATQSDTYGDEGSAARFFYCAKASRKDRDAGLDGERNPHPTAKSTDLMRYLVRLITPLGGIVLDPFTGSGGTGRGCVLEGMDFVGFEKDVEFAGIARRRIVSALYDA